MYFATWIVNIIDRCTVVAFVDFGCDVIGVDVFGVVVAVVTSAVVVVVVVVSEIGVEPWRCKESLNVCGGDAEFI